MKENKLEAKKLKKSFLKRLFESYFCDYADEVEIWEMGKAIADLAADIISWSAAESFWHGE